MGNNILKEVFEITAKQLELFYIKDLDLYFIPDCNLIVKYDKYHGIVYVYGKIPVDFAVGIYEEVISKNIKISNNYNRTFVDPILVCFHSEIDMKEIYDYCEKNLKNQLSDIEKIYREKIHEYLVKDYSNCYLSNVKLFSREALIWFVNKIRSYYLNRTNGITLDLIKRTDVK